MATTDYEGEDVIITFEKEGADTVTNVQAKIMSMNMTGGTGDVETVRTFGGKSFQVNKPVSDYEISFDYVTQDSKFAEVNLSGSATQFSATAEYSSGGEASKKRWRVIVWFLGTGASTASSGSVVVPKNAGEMLRYIFKDCYSVSNDESFTADDYAKGTLTLRLGAADESGYANVFKEYSSNAAGTTAVKLTVLTASTHRGVMTWATTTPAWTGSYRT